MKKILILSLLVLPVFVFAQQKPTFSVFGPDKTDYHMVLNWSSGFDEASLSIVCTPPNRVTTFSIKQPNQAGDTSYQLNCDKAGYMKIRNVLAGTLSFYPGTIPEDMTVEFRFRGYNNGTVTFSRDVTSPFFKNTGGVINNGTTNSPRVISGGTVSADELVGYKKVIAETSDGKVVDMSPKMISGGTVPVSELVNYEKIEIETNSGDTVEFTKFTGLGGQVPANEIVDFKKNIIVDTGEKISMQDKKIYVGGDEVKVMPKEAIESVNKESENSSVINVELKKTESKEGDNLNYEITSIQKKKIFWLFSKNVKIVSTVDAQTGDLIEVDKPWWSFIAF